MERMPVFFLVLSLFFLLPGGVSADEADLSVVVTGFGETEEHALEKALSEAVSAVVGALFAERSSLDGNNLKEQLLRYSRGTVKTYEVLEEKALEKGFSVTVRAFVNSTAISEKMNEFIKDFRADVSIVQDNTVRVEQLVDLLVEQLRSYSFEDFLTAEIASVKKDEKSHTLTLALRLVFDKELYKSRFASGVSFLLEKIVSEPDFSGLLFPENASEKKLSVVSFHMLGTNEASRAFTLPVMMADRIAGALGFSGKSEPKGAAFRGAWLHISLLNANGEELERIPVNLPLTNVVAFLMKRNAEPTVERAAKQIAAAEKRGTFSRSEDEVILAPAFGITNNSGNSEFMTDVIQKIAFELPGSLFSGTTTISARLHFEKW